ncbi:hypothetical protein ATY77_03165 [Rhizobium sp. R634]|uniref:aldo/keto reductase n=1 Tax=Rhizobium sp. R634 TaxID=1764274 RepID=UPI000B534A2E|nr:aldo/keto reductase [Rhizobium sp. R634]OWV82251.1 hypothetical protein ATY77_03165 [Rhizobium sp. R634]
MCAVELGLGLLSIGRQWGVNRVLPPDEEAALLLIDTAYSKGVRFFDTAPAYARSEAILGLALSRSLLPRNQVTVATKMGENWDARDGVARPDHSFDALAKSLDRSLELLGKIDVLQLHKANASNVTSPDVFRAFDRAESMGAKKFGASVSDFETAVIACKSGRYEYLQFPFNFENQSLQPVFRMLAGYRMKAIVNRPFAMGALVQNDADKGEKLFRFILEMKFEGVILTGTSSSSHLQANIEAFWSAIS